MNVQLYTTINNKEKKEWKEGTHDKIMNGEGNQEGVAFFQSKLKKLLHTKKMLEDDKNE
jgi:hypothetical protein